MKTIQTIRRTAALGALAALMLASGSPRDAAAHNAPYGGVHHPQPFEYNVARAPDSPQDSIVVAWNGDPETARSVRLLDYRVFVRETREEQLDPGSCISTSTTQQPSDGCIRRIVSLGGPSYRETITGLQPDRPYYVWVGVTYTHNFGEHGTSRTWGHSGWSGSDRRIPVIITTLPRQTTATPTTPSHPHPFAGADHSHSDLKHRHPFASSDHRHSTHNHPFAAADHTHEGTGTTPGASTTAAQTCPRFIELVDPWTFTRGYARELVTGSVWVAVHAIEYMRERTVPIVESARDGSDEVEGVEIRLMEAQATSAGGSTEHARSFILDGANLADVAASVRCRSAPVAVTTEDPPAPAPE